ncbi:hypothetical protein CEXT_351821 [Caerostris extrusa]|uniref:Reverse transcriptase domain-containing protein n=1 Tax=Caerostris extrusa TaxID=172846 RepID=A0AAV4RUB7_CAEEX|nr:hypothetical protein CEXT_351821 [Caerostris extrusa]
MERMVNFRLEAFLDSINAIHDEQAGFRKHKSAIDQVNKRSQQIKDGFHRQMSTLACFIDFKEVYDTVSRKLLYKSKFTTELHETC